MARKIEESAVKIYKPEILICPKCNNQLQYCYTISNKVVQFTSGKFFRIKNLGYTCSNCLDKKVYFSQTANKLSFKGYTYSSKIICMIDYYKNKGIGREGICDLLANKGIEISDRNVDVIHKKFLSFYNHDYDLIIKDAYNKMLDEYNEIRIAIDLITVNEIYYIILYDYFTGEKLAIWKINDLYDGRLEEIMSRYINMNYNISVIATIRNINRFVPFLKSLTKEGTKFIAFSKF